jgi:hypothetical protein
LEVTVCTPYQVGGWLHFNHAQALRCRLFNVERHNKTLHAGNYVLDTNACCVAGAVEEHPIKDFNFHVVSAFNDMSFHVFPAEKLRQAGLPDVLGAPGPLAPSATSEPDDM